MNILINAANVFFVLGYFTTDMLRLRLLSVVGTSCVVTYFYSQPEPMMNVVAWNLLFLLLNLVQVVQMLRTRWPRMATGRRGAVTP